MAWCKAWNLACIFNLSLMHISAWSAIDFNAANVAGAGGQCYVLVLFHETLLLEAFGQLPSSAL